MYLLVQGSGDATAFETARETLCRFYDLRAMAVCGASVTDCEGRSLTELQLTTLSIAAGLAALPHPTGS